MPRKAVMPKIMRVPYDAAGNLQHWPREDAVWRDNLPFHGTLRLGEAASVYGQAARYVRWYAPDGRTFPMNVVDVPDVVRFGVVDNGLVHGRWIVGKRGAGYGLRCIPQETE